MGNDRLFWESASDTVVLPYFPFVQVAANCHLGCYDGSVSSSFYRMLVKGDLSV